MDCNQRDRTLWCGNLHENVSEELLYELFLQAGPLDQIKIPTNETGKQKAFAFITFRHVDSVPYCVELMSDISLFGRTLRLQFRSGSVHEQQDLPHRQKQQLQSQKPPVMGMQSKPHMRQMQMMQHGSYNLNAYNPLCPPMGTVLQATNFHRSQSAPNFVPQTSQAQFTGQLMSQNVGHNLYSQNFNPSSHQKDSSVANSQYSREMNPERGQKRSYDDRVRGGDDPSRYRSGDICRDRSNEDRRGRDSDRRGQRRDLERRDERRDSDRREPGRRNLDGGSSGRISRRDADVDAPTEAFRNFRRQMVSPPWQRSKAPWEK